MNDQENDFSQAQDILPSGLRSEADHVAPSRQLPTTSQHALSGPDSLEDTKSSLSLARNL